MFKNIALIFLLSVTVWGKSNKEKPLVFFPVPKAGCPGGYYRVENTIFDGLNFHAACWSSKLNQIESVQSEISFDLETVCEMSKPVLPPPPKPKREEMPCPPGALCSWGTETEARK